MLLPFDELNNIRTQIEGTAITENGKTVYDKDLCIDIVLDALILAYIYGVDYANETLGTEIETDPDKMRETIYKRVADKTFSDRVSEYAEEGDIERIMEVARTDSHRVFNTASYDTAEKGGAKTKRWVCQFINSRDTHIYLHGTEKPMDEEFYTFMGNHAMFPGQFGVAEEDCNCQCVLEFK